MNDRVTAIETKLKELEDKIKVLDEKSKPYANEVAFMSKPKKAVKSD